MAKVLEDGFRLFIEELTPTEEELTVPVEHREAIEDSLREQFGLYAFFRSGSSLGETSVRGHTDLDYFASLETSAMPDTPRAFLAEVEQALTVRFPQAGVKVAGHAIVVPWDAGSEPAIRVVPARLAGQTRDGYRVYQIADGDRDCWMRTSPDAHSHYIAEQDAELDGHLKPLIRLLKAWKYFRQVPISSYYLELRCVRYAAQESLLVYPLDMQHLLEQLWADQFADVEDPAGICGPVPARSSRAERQAIISKLRNALYHISRAQEAVAAERIAEAFHYWNRVFGGHFPAYG